MTALLFLAGFLMLLAALAYAIVGGIDRAVAWWERKQRRDTLSADVKRLNELMAEKHRRERAARKYRNRT